MFSILPWYVRWGALAAALVAAFCGGAVEGIKYQEGVQARAEVKVEQHAKVVRKQHAVETNKIEKAAVVTKQHRDADREKANVETVDHAKLPDPAECALAPERVRSINDAWLGSASDSGAGSAGVRNAAAAEERKPSGSGTVGQGTGLRIPGMPGSAARAVSEGASPSTVGGNR